MLASTLALFAGTLIVSAQDIKNWKVIAPENEEFSVLMPEIPKTATSDLAIYPQKDQPFTAKCAVYVLVKDGVLFSVQSFATEKPQELVKELFADKFNPPVKLPLDLRFNEKHLIDGKHLYIIRVAHRQTEDPRAALFFQSFTTKKKKVSKKSLLVVAAGSDAPATLPDNIFKTKEVTHKAVILARPAPSYTNEARKNGVVGTVVVRVLLSSNGRVEVVTPLAKLPDNLLEQAVNVAKLIIFVPAEKDGKAVSQWVQVEYSFNLY